jgi:hypothetical protein
MIVLIKHLIPFVERRLCALLRQIEEDVVENLKLEKEFNDKFFNKLLNNKYQSNKYPWSKSPSQDFKDTLTFLRGMVYHSNNNIKDTVNLGEFCSRYSSMYSSIEAAILTQHAGDYSIKEKTND